DHLFTFLFSSRRRHTRFSRDWSSDVCSSDLNVADLPLEVQADLFGHELTEDGILIRRANAVPPWVAVGYKTLKSNGSYRYTWLAKGKFVEPEQSNQTKGDSIEFNTPTTVGNFVRRECDDEWIRQ